MYVLFGTVESTVPVFEGCIHMSVDEYRMQFPYAGFPVLSYQVVSSFLIMFVHILQHEVPSENSIIVQGTCTDLPSVPPRHPIST